MPFFSIIIPVYNVAPYLRECLNSVWEQTYTDWECLCIDDGSTDESGTILDEYARKDHRFRIVHQTNAGVSAARNIALGIAKGKWIWFVDGDDALHPQSLEMVMRAIRLHPSSNTVALEYTRGTTIPTPWKMGGHLNPDFWPVAVDESTKLFLHGIWLYILQREAIGELQFPPFRHNEDGVFLYSYMPKGFGIIAIHQKLYFNRIRQGSATHPTSISPEIVRNTMATRRLQVDSLSTFGATIGDENLQSCWRHLYSKCAKGAYFGWLFQLSSRDQSRLLPEWLSLLTMFRKHYRPPLEQRIRIGLIRLFPSSRLVKRLAIGWLPGLHLCLRAIHFLTKSTK